MKMNNWKKDKNYLKKMYTERFGTKEERENGPFFILSPRSKNLDTTFIADLYKENGVELK